IYQIHAGDKVYEGDDGRGEDEGDAVGEVDHAVAPVGVLAVGILQVAVVVDGQAVVAEHHQGDQLEGHLDEEQHRGADQQANLKLPGRIKGPDGGQNAVHQQAIFVPASGGDDGAHQDEDGTDHLAHQEKVHPADAL